MISHLKELAITAELWVEILVSATRASAVAADDHGRGQNLGCFPDAGAHARRWALAGDASVPQKSVATNETGKRVTSCLGDLVAMNKHSIFSDCPSR